VSQEGTDHIAPSFTCNGARSWKIVMYLKRHKIPFGGRKPGANQPGSEAEAHRPTKPPSTVVDRCSHTLETLETKTNRENIKTGFRSSNHGGLVGLPVASSDDNPARSHDLFALRRSASLDGRHQENPRPAFAPSKNSPRNRPIALAELVPVGPEPRTGAGAGCEC